YAGTDNNSVIIDMCEFDNNSTIGSVEQISGNTGGGGAIFIGAFQNVAIYNSTFHTNSAKNTPTGTASADAYGGAIWMLSSSPIATSELIIDSSTFDENDAYGVGGAIAIGGPGFPADYSLVDIKHSTITRNQADENESNSGYGGGGIYTSASTPVDIFNNVLATNKDNSITNNRSNLSGVFNTLGHNFINGNQGISASFPLGLPNANDDLVGMAFKLPDLQPMSVTGGSTLTRSPDSDSPLIDQGRCGNKITDQRGYFNPMSQVRIINDNFFSQRGGDFSDGCDIGAVEYSASESNAFPNGNNDTFNIFEDDSITLVNEFNVLENDDDPEGAELIILNAGLITTNSANINNPGEVDLWTNGDFTYDTPSDEFGTLDFTYNVSDGNMDSNGNVTLNILPVNDAPSFQYESDYFSFVGTNSVAGLYDYPHWAFNISTGPANESSQNAQFIIQVTGDTHIFATLPSVTILGTLNLDIAENALGLASIRVTLKDNGGTVNGGMDESDDIIINVNTNLDSIFSSSFEDLSGT
ncbi:MAG: Ig-like domain-containing protein, partial [Marinicellaceae bacterium]